jgi:pilus assembly protein CpaF
VSTALTSVSGSPAFFPAEAPGATDPEEVVAARVRDRLRAERIDPALDPAAAHRFALAEVRRHNDVALARGLPLVDDEAACIRAALAHVTGFGPLQPYLDDPGVEEIWINAPDRVFAARAGVSERLPIRLTDEHPLD